jgi:DMSO/TMAO reductase YedYZ molybdopterin-dependent catalytic subunit
MKRTKPKSAVNRRQFLRYTGAAGLAGVLGARAGHAWGFGGYTPAAGSTVTLPFENGLRPVVQYPEKRPLIQLTTRPPLLETPFSVFDGNVLTPNDAFYVRYHNSYFFGGPPTGPQTIDENTFRVAVGGNVTTPLSLSVADLKANFRKMEIVAVNQCSGNSRGFFAPRVRGGQWGNGAMGNARWTGVSLKDVLNKAGVGAGAAQVAFNGIDQSDGEPPDYEKALDVSVAMNGEVMLAYAMNGEELPMLNGFPLRLVVPGYYATYWVKHVNAITVVNAPYDTYYMTTAYRVPDNACNCVPPGTVPASTVPIGKLNVRSFITNLADADKLSWLSLMFMGMTVRGIAFDGGSGIKKVEFSSDGGASWRTATLGMNYGNYSFRQWSILFFPGGPGEYVLKVRAVNNAGATQPLEPLWNPSGFMRNVVETTRITVT